MIRLIAIMLVVMSFISCYSYRVDPSISQAKRPSSPPLAFVVNPLLVKEYEILAHAGIYRLVSDSSASTYVTLYPITRRFRCGNPLIAFVFTLGQVPIVFNDPYVFRFDEVTNGQTTTHVDTLTVNTRVWFWDMFLFKRNFEATAGRALRYEELQLTGRQ